MLVGVHYFTDVIEPWCKFTREFNTKQTPRILIDFKRFSNICNIVQWYLQCNFVYLANSKSVRNPEKTSTFGIFQKIWDVRRYNNCTVFVWLRRLLCILVKGSSYTYWNIYVFNSLFSNYMIIHWIFKSSNLFVSPMFYKWIEKRSNDNYRF